MLGMMVDAASVDGANTEGAYDSEWPSLDDPPSEEVEGEGEWPVKGTLGRLKVGVRSKPKDELRREAASKFPDRLPRRVAVKVKPESFRGTFGIGGGG